MNEVVFFDPKNDVHSFDWWKYEHGKVVVIAKNCFRVNDFGGIVNGEQEKCFFLVLAFLVFGSIKYALFLVNFFRQLGVDFADKDNCYVKDLLVKGKLIDSDILQIFGQEWPEVMRDKVFIFFVMCMD